MSCKAEIDACQEEEVVSEAFRILELDLAHDSLRENTFKSKIAIRVASEGEVTGLVGWFDVLLAEGVSFSTSPLAPPTHWKQTFFYFNQPVKCCEGTILEGSISVQASKNNYRALDIQLDINACEDQKLKQFCYTLE